jgi:hypothetical protein
MVDMKNIRKYNNKVLALVSFQAFLFFAKVGGSCADDIEDLKRAF